MSMKSRASITFLALFALLVLVSAAYAGGASRVADAIWADGELYDTVITPTTFIAPPERSTDIIYSFMMSGLEGQRSVAESAPGDSDYNGGRWNVQMVVFTADGIAAHDPDGDGIVNFELTSAEDVVAHEQLGHLIINDANFYFECPLLPRRGDH
jgi:hypothetical protein